MAIQSPTAELLLLCRQRFPQALDFLMIGRQWLRLRPADAARLEKNYGLQVTDLADPEGTDTIYAEPLLHRMGLKTIEALDASAYEGADVVHDLNRPLPSQLHGHCDWVFDGGSLEHIFDFPTAVRNCSSLLRPGGLFVSVCPVNNWVGHGFYQFSPELFFRVFAPAHGFSVKFAALQVNNGTKRSFYSLRDPAETGHRLQYNPPGRSTLLFVAQKLDTAESSAWQVQQSDYSARWKTQQPATAQSQQQTSGPLRAIKKQVSRLLPKALVSVVRDWRVQRRKQKKDSEGLQLCDSLAEAWAKWQ